MNFEFLGLSKLKGVRWSKLEGIKDIWELLIGSATLFPGDTKVSYLDDLLLVPILLKYLMALASDKNSIFGFYLSGAFYIPFLVVKWAITVPLVILMTIVCTPLIVSSAIFNLIKRLKQSQAQREETLTFLDQLEISEFNEPAKSYEHNWRLNETTPNKKVSDIICKENEYGKKITQFNHYRLRFENANASPIVVLAGKGYNMYSTMHGRRWLVYGVIKPTFNNMKLIIEYLGKPEAFRVLDSLSINSLHINCHDFKRWCDDISIREALALEVRDINLTIIRGRGENEKESLLTTLPPNIRKKLFAYTLIANTQPEKNKEAENDENNNNNNVMEEEVVVDANDNNNNADKLNELGLFARLPNDLRDNIYKKVQSEYAVALNG